MTGDYCGTITGARHHRATRQPLCTECADHIRNRVADLTALLDPLDRTPWANLIGLLADVMLHPERHPKDAR